MIMLFAVGMVIYGIVALLGCCQCFALCHLLLLFGQGLTSIALLYATVYTAVFLTIPFLVP